MQTKKQKHYLFSISCSIKKYTIVLNPFTVLFLSFLTLTYLVYPQENNLERGKTSVTNSSSSASFNPLGTIKTQTGIWTEIRPNVPRVDYWGVYFANADTGFACGVNGTIIKTIDAGSSWTTLISGTTKTLKTIGSYDGSLIIAAGDSGIIISSADYGENWSTITSGVNNNLWNFQFVSDKIAWIVGEGSTVLKTIDGGLTWQNQVTPLPGYAYWDVSFIDTLFGYISCDGGKILRTTDNGVSWDVKQAGDNYGLFTIEAITRTNAVALGFAGKHVYTSDGGANWNFITFLGGSEPNNIDFIDTLHGFAVGFGGCYESTNGGRNWIWRSDMVDGASIVFSANNTAYYVGKNLTIRKTTDTGLIWKKCVINDDFIDVFFTDENTGWIIGQELYKSILYKTYDGGVTLVPIENFPVTNPSTVFFIDNQEGFVGARNKILHTTDAGLNWQETTLNGYDSLLVGGEFKRFFFLTNEMGWAINSGSIVKTTDGGFNWFVQLNDEILEGIHFSDPQNGWVTRGGGGIAQPFRTSDGGLNWIEQTNLTLSSTGDVYFKDSLNGFITSQTKLYKTTDGGLQWWLVPEIITASRFSKGYNNNNIFSIASRIYQSTNNGETWIEIIDIRNLGISYIMLNEINKGYAIGSQGLVIKYYDETLPVELTSFDASINDVNNIILRWSTATETNNRGFTIERLKISRSEEQDWKDVGFVNGAGTTTETKMYLFIDENLNPGKYKYRLKQIDFDGSFEYSNIVEVKVRIPFEFFLSQNYPNPFNPTTQINYSIKEGGLVQLKIYDILGKEIATLVNENKETGNYIVDFNAAELPSGVYIYQLTTPGFTQARKMILAK